MGKRSIYSIPVTESIKVDISDLPKEKVIIALFNNVFRKSEASKNT